MSCRFAPAPRATILFLAVVVTSAKAGGAAAQSTENLQLADVATSPRWTVVGRTASVVDGKGQQALKLSEGPGAGIVWLNGYDFANGTVELDMLGRSHPVGRSFVGVAFRVVDGTTYDAVYSGRSTFTRLTPRVTITPRSTSPTRVGRGRSSAPSGLAASGDVL